MKALPAPYSPLHRLLLALSLILGVVAPASAHRLDFTDTLILVKADGTYQVDMHCDLDALALGAPPDTDNSLLLAELQTLDEAALQQLHDKLKNFFERRVRILVDGERAPPHVSFPHRGTALALTGEPPAYFGAVARFEGSLPDDAEHLQVKASRALPPLLVRFAHLENEASIPLPVEPGAESDAYPLASGEGSYEDATPVGTLAQLQRYLVLGFHHILPAGVDHVLFVLGLFLLDPRLRPLILQVTAFTVAHAVTLALATTGVVTVPGSVVEPLIAASIAWVALENIWLRRRSADGKPPLPSWRLPMIFALGLLHGLGFAGALAAVGLPESSWLLALVSFNVGIEVGQVTVLLLAFAAVGWWRERPWFGNRVVLPACLVIAAMGLFWTFERLLS